MKKVVIYTGQRCAHCDWAKALLNKKNVDFYHLNNKISYHINPNPISPSVTFIYKFD